MIQANNVTVQFGGRALFERVNVTFSKGNCYGIIGANGAGKSTFLKVLDGELEPQKGEVVITPRRAAQRAQAGPLCLRPVPGGAHRADGQPPSH